MIILVSFILYDSSIYQNITAKTIKISATDWSEAELVHLSEINVLHFYTHLHLTTTIGFVLFPYNTFLSEIFNTYNILLICLFLLWIVKTNIHYWIN